MYVHVLCCCSRRWRPCLRGCKRSFQSWIRRGATRLPRIDALAKLGFGGVFLCFSKVLRRGSHVVLKQAPERDRGESSCISIMALAAWLEQAEASKVHACSCYNVLQPETRSLVDPSFFYLRLQASTMSSRSRKLLKPNCDQSSGINCVTSCGGSARPRTRVRDGWEVVGCGE